jgi:thiol peroxidase
MEKTFLGTLEVHTCGYLPQVGDMAPDFELVATDLSDIRLSDLKGKKVVLNIFPSIDTEVCAQSVRRFNKDAASIDNCVVLCISRDLPFAAARFCTVNGIENAKSASAFRSTFGKDYGVEMTDGPLKGLFARAVILIDEEGKIKAKSLCENITEEPDYNILAQF